MILKKFYRKPSTKIYFILLLILFFVVCLINVFIEYLKNIDNEYFKDMSLVYIESLIDYKDLLEKEDNLENIKEVLVFDYVESPFEMYNLTMAEIDNKVIVTYDSNLNKNEIIIGLRSEDYIIYESNVQDILDSSFKALNKDEVLEFKIKDVFNSNNHVEISISKEDFKILANDFEEKMYLANMKSEELEDKTTNYLYDAIDGKVISLEEISYEKYQLRIAIQEYIKYLEIASYIIIIVFIITVIIIDKNIIADLNYDVSLEYRLGFNRMQICMNVIKRLVSLHFLNFICSIIIFIPTVYIINNIFNVSLNINEITSSIHLLVIIIFSDLLLGLIANNKSNYGRR